MHRSCAVAVHFIKVCRRGPGKAATLLSPALSSCFVGSMAGMGTPIGVGHLLDSLLELGLTVFCLWGATL